MKNEKEIKSILEALEKSVDKQEVKEAAPEVAATEPAPAPKRGLDKYEGAKAYVHNKCKGIVKNLHKDAPDAGVPFEVLLKAMIKELNSWL